MYAPEKTGVPVDFAENVFCGDPRFQLTGNRTEKKTIGTDSKNHIAVVSLSKRFSASCSAI